VVAHFEFLMASSLLDGVILRVCDFFDFAKTATLKTKQLTREKSGNFQ